MYIQLLLFSMDDRKNDDKLKGLRNFEIIRFGIEMQFNFEKYEKVAFRKGLIVKSKTSL